MLLGVTAYSPSNVSALQPELPLTEEALERLQQQEDRFTQFRASAVGNTFGDDPADSGDGTSAYKEYDEKNGLLDKPEKSQPAHKRAKSSASSAAFVGSASSQWTLPNASQGMHQHYQHIYSPSELLDPTTASNIDGILNGLTNGTEVFTAQDTPFTFSTPLSQGDRSITAFPDTSENFMASKLVWEKNPYSGHPRVYGTTSGFPQSGRAPSSTMSRPLEDTHSLHSFPSQLLCARLVDAYLNIIHPALPMCSRLNLMQWACNPNLSSDPNLRPELIFAIFAVALPYLPSPLADDDSPLIQNPSVDSCSLSARACISRVAASPSLSTVQALLLLTLSDWGQGEFSLAWNNLCMSTVKQCWTNGSFL